MFTENLDLFFTDFGVAATLDGAAVRGVFDRDYAQAFDGISTSAPQFVCKTTSAAAATQASLLVLDGTTYRVRSVQPNGTGITRLLLEVH